MVIATYTEKPNYPPSLVEIICYDELSEWVYVDFIYDREFGGTYTHQDNLSNICEADDQELN